MNPTTLVQDLIAIMNRLIALLERENGMLRAMRPQEIRPLQADKNALGLAYQAVVRELARVPDALNSVNKALMVELRRTTERFNEIANENMRAIKAGQETNTRLVAIIVEAVKGSRTKSGLYAKSGAFAERADDRAPVLSLALDRRL